MFKILKVFLEVKPTSVERELGSLSSTGGPKLQHISFIIIVSGMALFAIQLIRVVITSVMESAVQVPISLKVALDFVIVIHDMLNVIIRPVSFSTLYCFTNDIFTLLGHCTNNNFGAGFNEIVHR